MSGKNPAALQAMALDRREFLGALAVIAANSMLPGEAKATANPRLKSDPFQLGVASGSPLPDGVVLWTRLAGKEVERYPALGVRWELFEDGRPGKIVACGRTLAVADLAHSVHVEVGGLRPDRWYGYRFMIGDAVSPIGRTRTLPSVDGAVETMRFAYASCQRWEDGYYAAYRHMLAESPDLVVFVGDYIYEYPSRANAARNHSLPHIRTLADYRQRYALYKSDADLQRMHAACPWLVTWDDHEVENNYAGLVSAEGTVDLAAKRAAAYRAYYEHMPLRAASMIRGLAGLRREGALRIYNRVDFGRLASFHLLDNRQYRDAPLCKDVIANMGCRNPEEESRTMLGFEQEGWLDNGLRQAAQRGAQWNVLAQQTVFSPRNYHSGPGREFSADTWDGYPSARLRLLAAIARHRPANPLFIGGDIHQNWVANVHQDPYDVHSPVLAAEFCGTSIASRGMAQDRVARIAAASPHALMANSERRGYGVVELGRKEAVVRLRVVDDAGRADAAISTQASFRVEDGRPGIVPEAVPPEKRDYGVK